MRLSQSVSCGTLRRIHFGDSGADSSSGAGRETLLERLRFITHRDQRILLLDFSNCSAAEVSELADLAPRIVTQEAPGSVLAMADFGGAEFDREAIEHIKIATAFDRAHIKRAAWVHAENLPKVLYDSIRSFSAREFPVFTTREEALEYLVSGELPTE